MKKNDMVLAEQTKFYIYLYNRSDVLLLDRLCFVSMYLQCGNLPH